MKIEIPLNKQVDIMKIAEQLEKVFGVKLIQRGKGDKIHGYLGQIFIMGQGKIIIELFERDEPPNEHHSYYMVKHPLAEKELEDFKIKLEELIKQQQEEETTTPPPEEEKIA